MKTPAFGLSTTPVTDTKSELRQQLERDLLALYLRDGITVRCDMRTSPPTYIWPVK